AGLARHGGGGRGRRRRDGGAAPRRPLSACTAAPHDPPRGLRRDILMGPMEGALAMSVSPHHTGPPCTCDPRRTAPKARDSRTSTVTGNEISSSRTKATSVVAPVPAPCPC